MNNAAQIDRIRGHVSELKGKAHHLRAKRIAADYYREVSAIADVRKDYAHARAAVLAEVVRTGGSLGAAIRSTMPPRSRRRAAEEKGRGKQTTSRPNRFIPVSGAAPGDHAGFALRSLRTAKANAAEFSAGMVLGDI
jgi:hypothetical protein